MDHYYEICCKHIGKPARVHTKDGQMYEGIIARVTPHQVLLIPAARGMSGEGKMGTVYTAQTAELNHGKPEGTEILFFGWWIPFVAIATLALFPFFFWW